MFESSLTMEMKTHL